MLYILLPALDSAALLAFARWSSTLSARAVRLRNTTVKLPEPEFLHLAALARVSKAFVVELAGETGDGCWALSGS